MLQYNGKIITYSPDETLNWAGSLAENLHAADSLFLIGKLGSGKTVIARGIIWGLGYEGVVCSPSFNLIKTYPGRLRVHHCDLYRLSPGDEMRDLGMDDAMDEDAVTIFEWSEDFPLAQTLPRYEIQIEVGYKDEERIIRWRYFEKSK